MSDRVPKIKLKRLTRVLSKTPAYRVVSPNMVPAAAGTSTAMDYSYNVPTANKFIGLSASADDSANSTTVPSGTYRAPKAQKPQSFVIYYNQMTKLANIKSIAGKFNIKRLDNGTIQLHPTNTDAEELIRSEMKVHGVEFHTHNNIKLHKYVLYGLTPMDCSLVISEISKATGGKINPTNVNRMKISNPKYDDHCNYLVYFHTNPTLPVLNKEARILFDYNVVTWRPYHNNHKGPIQCSNCQDYGHGAFGCNRPPKCRVCAEKHQTKDCSLIIEKRRNNNEKIHQSLLKCAGCNANHTASYSGCPKKPVFVTRPSYHHHQQQQQYKQPMINDREQFPSISLHKNQRYENNLIEHNNINVNRAWTNHGQSNDLFTVEEMQLILSDIFKNLRTCTSKEEQFQLMFKLSAKYVYNR